MAATTATSMVSGNRVVTVLKDLASRPSGAIGLTLVTFHVALALVSP